MKQLKTLHKSESGVIHHLGLIILGIIVVAAIGFAIIRIQADDDPNFGYDGTTLEEIEEDATQAELDEASDESDASIAESDQESAETANLSEENDAIN